MTIKGLYGKGTYDFKVGECICECCGSRVAGKGKTYIYREDEDGCQEDIYVNADFETLTQGIIIQEGIHGEAGIGNGIEVSHIQTSNGPISVKIEYEW